VLACLGSIRTRKRSATWRSRDIARCRAVHTGVGQRPNPSSRGSGPSSGSRGSPVQDHPCRCGEQSASRPNFSHQKRGCRCAAPAISAAQPGPRHRAARRAPGAARLARGRRVRRIGGLAAGRREDRF
jgi:hypothetical protein